MMIERRNALLSVSDKTGIVEFAEGLHELDWNIYASGGTCKKIAEGGVPVTDVAELVGGEALLGHRVVTLSREVHAGLLADPNKVDEESGQHVDLEELEKLGIPYLGLVAVDMYPLERAIADGLPEEEVIEKTDIGGPTLLRSAAKGRRIVLSRAEQRPVVLDWLQEGSPDEENVRRTLAATAEYEVAKYVAKSALYLGELAMKGSASSSYEATLRGLLPDYS